MQVQSIIDRIELEFTGVVAKQSWGETSLFYNPGNTLPNGVYFCTIKEQNGKNDQASNLDGPGVFRLSVGITKKTYEKIFGCRPKRPTKGGIVDTGHDFSALNEVMPHPIYAWMSWIQVLNPTESTFNSLMPLILEGYNFVYNSADGPKPSIVHLYCPIEDKIISSHIEKNNFQRVSDNQFKKEAIEIEFKRNNTGKVTLITIYEYL